MILLFKYDFPDNSPRSIRQIVDSISPPAGYYGFERVYVSLVPGSDPVNLRLPSNGLNFPLQENVGQQRNGGSYDVTWLDPLTVTPVSGASWSIFVCLAHTGQTF